jgi:hypothetical protein
MVLRSTNPLKLKNSELRGQSPRENYTDQATAACWQSWCQLLRTEGYKTSPITTEYQNDTQQNIGNNNNVRYY